MSIQLNPYLNLRGTASEALDYYQAIFGGDVNKMTFAQMGGEAMGVAADEVGWLMHGALNAGPGLNVMVSDVPSNHGDSINNGYIALSGAAADGDQLRAAFEKLADGGEVHVPLEKAPWGDWFGQTADRFGIVWMVNIAGE